MEKLLKDKKILIISIIVIIAILVLIFLSFNNKKSNNSVNKGNKESLDTILTNLGKNFYEEHYYNKLDDKSKLANFQESGLNISLTSLNVIMPIPDEVNNKLKSKKCDMDKSKILIYPKDPYSVNDYNIKVELTCNK